MSATGGFARPQPADERVEMVPADRLASMTSILVDEGFSPALVSCTEVDASLVVSYLLLRGDPDSRVELQVEVPTSDPVIPSLGGASFALSRFEREAHDMFGLVPRDHPLARRLVLHAHWPDDYHPMRKGAEVPNKAALVGRGAYPFIPVEGPGTYEIPVGPVHAGIIEPGHFRFWVAGESILRMKARLWFVHRGVELLFEGADPATSIPLSERISGDTAIGHSLAYASAVEQALGIRPSMDVLRRRAILLELERIYNHVGDCGGILNDVAYSLANAGTMALKERLLRHNKEITGHRLLRGAISLGATDLRSLPRISLLEAVVGEFHGIVDVALANTVVMDRLQGTGVLSLADARAIGTVGPVARASGLRGDARRDHPQLLIDGIEEATHHDGDVLARLLLRGVEIDNSLSLLRSLCGGLRARDDEPSVAEAGAFVGRGVGIVEGSRGRIVHRVELDGPDRLGRVKIVDPSFLNWPALPFALADTIVPDFPLINKSFSLSYAGNDL